VSDQSLEKSRLVDTKRMRAQSARRMPHQCLKVFAADLLDFGSCQLRHEPVVEKIALATIRVLRRCWPLQSAHLREALAQFGDEELGLLKRGEVTAFRNLVPVEEFRIGLIAPHLRRRKEVALEDAHRNR